MVEHTFIQELIAEFQFVATVDSVSAGIFHFELSELFQTVLQTGVPRFFKLAPQCRVIVFTGLNDSIHLI